MELVFLAVGLLTGLILSPFVSVKSAFSLGKICGIASGLLIAAKRFKEEKKA